MPLRLLVLSTEPPKCGPLRVVPERPPGDCRDCQIEFQAIESRSHLGRRTSASVQLPLENHAQGTNPLVMDGDSQRLRAKVAALNNSLDDLESQLEPLLAQTLPESLVGLETIQQAKLQVALPYLVYDLIFSAYEAVSLPPILTTMDSLSQDKRHRPEDASCNS